VKHLIFSVLSVFISNGYNQSIFAPSALWPENLAKHAQRPVTHYIAINRIHAGSIADRLHVLSTTKDVQGGLYMDRNHLLAELICKRECI
jgi:hypothetical protein